MSSTPCRDSQGNPISADAARSNYALRGELHRFRPIRPDPTEPHVIGTIDGLPVIQATDLGETPHSDLMREAAFMLPGDPRVHRTLLDIGTVPRHRSGSWICLPDSPLRVSGYYLVLNTDDETWDMLDGPKPHGAIQPATSTIR